MAKQAHDLGVRKRKISEPIRHAALLRRLNKKAKGKAPPDWYKTWLRTNKYPTRQEYAYWEATGIG